MSTYYTWAEVLNPPVGRQGKAFSFGIFAPEQMRKCPNAPAPQKSVGFACTFSPMPDSPLTTIERVKYFRPHVLAIRRHKRRGGLGGERLFPTNIKMKVRNKTKDTIIVENAIMADTFWRRLIGLMGKAKLEDKCGIILTPCNSVHTMFMRFPIDVIFLSHKLEVLLIKQKLRPWAISPIIADAKYVLEINAGKALESRTEVGDTIDFLTCDIPPQ